MTDVGVGYDLGCSTYSPAGRVFQVEYATKAVNNSGTVIGISCKDGVVLAVEKLIRSKMMVTASYHRILTTSFNSGLAIGGVLPDGRQLVNRCRDEASNYKRNFGIAIPGKILSQRLAMYVHAYTEYWHLRPFGVSSLMAIYDDDGPQLYMIEPSGECHKYFAIAVGKGSQHARVELEKLDLKQMTCAEAIVKCAEIIYSIHDEVKDKPFELEISWVSDASEKKHELIPKALLEQAKQAGVRAADDDSDSDDDEEEEEEEDDAEMQAS
jgi:20S proteasome subunit alpha 7